MGCSGCCRWIVAFEQDGADRAAYGDKLLVGLAESLSAAGTTGLSARNLRNCRQVALAFPTLDPRDLAMRSLAHPGALEILAGACQISRARDIT